MWINRLYIQHLANSEAWACRTWLHLFNNVTCPYGFKVLGLHVCLWGAATLYKASCFLSICPVNVRLKKKLKHDPFPAGLPLTHIYTGHAWLCALKPCPCHEALFDHSADKQTWTWAFMKQSPANILLLRYNKSPDNEPFHSNHRIGTTPVGNMHTYQTGLEWLMKE